MPYNTIAVEKQDGVLTVKINRPGVLNALDQEAFDELEKVFIEANNDLETKVAILTGEGKAFSAGGDMSLLKVVSGGVSSQIRHVVFGIFKQINRMAEFEKPLIVAINGPAVGVGLAIALLGDFRIAAEGAVMSMEFVRVGIIPEAGSSYSLTRLVGYGKAVEMALTGKRVTAKEALEIGLVNRVVPAEDLAKAARELAAELSRLPVIALKLAKRAMKAGLAAGSIETAMEYEATLNSICYATEDHKEAVKAFMEKRKPNFIGR
jgi:2-(1,2-epoxy-1,2-dihydrophenyl)acetyl-CoA isomerase